MKRKAAKTKRTGIKVESAKLEAKIALFVEAYIQNGSNGAQAYLAAGYRGKNAEVAATGAYRMLRKPHIAAMIQKRRAEVLAASMLTSEEVLQDIARALRFNPKSLYHADGSAKQIHELDDDSARSLVGYEVTPVYGMDGEGKRVVIGWDQKVKWLDKNQVREQANKHFGHYERDNKQQGEAQIRSLLEAISENAAKFDIQP